MAAYLDVRGLFSSSDLGNKIDVATIIAANNLLAGTPTADDQRWVAPVFKNPQAESKKALMAVLATHNGLTVEQITGATDAAIQTAVDSVVTTLVIAHAG